MRKRGEGSGIWIGISIFVLFIIVVVTLFIVLSQDGGEEIQKVEDTINLYLRATNYLNESEQVAANYRIEANNTLIEEGILSKDSVTEINVPRKDLVLICWADGYYLGRTYKIFSQEELLSNASKGICNMRKIGEINVTHTGDIKEGESIIRLNISSDGNYGKLKICNRWSAGIISALPVSSELMCDSGNWLNWSKYNSTTKEYTMMPETYFRCGECNYPYCDWTSRCSSVNGRSCKVYSMKVPNRYVGRVDNCYYSGRSLRGDSVIIDYLVKTSNLNQLDEITFYIMDSDRRFNPSENMLTYMTEQNGENLGAEDTTYKINYWDLEWN